VRECESRVCTGVPSPSFKASEHIFSSFNVICQHPLSAIFVQLFSSLRSFAIPGCLRFWRWALRTRRFTPAATANYRVWPWLFPSLFVETPQLQSRTLVAHERLFQHISRSWRSFASIKTYLYTTAIFFFLVVHLNI
jgi:hypothetical protein